MSLIDKAGVALEHARQLSQGERADYSAAWFHVAFAGVLALMAIATETATVAETIGNAADAAQERRR